jgi:hypothetical protein
MKLKFLFLFLCASVMGWGQVNINAASTNYTQNFNSLANTGSANSWADNITLTGWYARTTNTATINTYGVNTGATTTAALYSFGSTSSTDRALGFGTSNSFTGAAGTGMNLIGWRLKNNTGAKISSLTVTWTGEQWRRDNTVAQYLNLKYQKGTTVTDLLSGTWIDTSSFFSSPNFVGAAGALDGNVTGNRTANITITINVEIENGEEIMLRWEDLNDSGNDHMLAIDDVTINVEVSSTCTKPETPNGDISGTTPACNTTTLTYTHGTNQPEDDIDYYWQTSATGTNTTNLANNALPVNTTGNYYVRAYNSETDCWSDATSAYSVTITSGSPSITTQPASTSVIQGNPATFSVTATGAVSYQWQLDSGTGFNDISGANSGSYNTGATTMAMNGYQYRVIITNICGNTTSNAATLTVTAGLENDNCSGAIGLNVNATATTAGTFLGATPSSGFTQSDVWYSFTPSCTSEHTITVSDFSGTDLDFAVYATNCPVGSSTTIFRSSTSSNNPETNTFTYNGGTTYYIRVYKFNNSGTDTNFNIRVITPNIGTPTTITASPNTFCAGATVTFTTSTVTNATSYVWTVPTGWTILDYPTTTTMRATVGTNPGNVTSQAVNCYGTGIAKSQAFTPSVIPATPSAITGNTEVCAGSSNTYSVAAVSGATSYTWTLPAGWTGTSTTNTITVTSNNTGGTISVTANSSCGSSSPQTLNVTVTPLPNTPSTPTSDNAACGPVTLTRGNPPANEVWYWQGTDANGTSETNSNLTFLANTSGTYYIRSKNTVTGCWSSSASITVSVNDNTSITTQPANQTVSIGSQATFTVSTTGSGLSYQWQESTDNGVNWNNVSGGSGATTSSYTTVNTTLAMNGYQYRVVITGPCGNVTSNGLATLNVVEIVYANGDFRSFSDGTWTNHSTPGTARWEKYVSGSWILQDLGIEPTGTAGSFTVYITHNIEVPASGVLIYGNAKIHVLSGGKFTHSNTSNLWTYRNVIVDNNGTFQLNSRFTTLSSGELEVKNGGNFIFNSNTAISSLTSNVFAGTEKFHPNSNIRLYGLDTGIYLTPGVLTAITPNSDNAYFGNIIVEYANGSGNFILFGSGTYTSSQFQSSICNDLIFRTSNNQAARIYQAGSSYIGQANPITINRNLIIEDTFTQSISFTTASQGSGSYYLKVNNDFIHNAPIAFYHLNNQTNNNALYYLIIGRNMELGNNSRYIFRTNQNSSASMYLQIAGNLSVSSTGGILDEGTNASTLGNIWFNGTTPQLVDFKNQNSNTKVLYSIRNGSYTQLVHNIKLGSLSTFNIQGSNVTTFGTFDASTYTLSGTSSNPLTANSYGRFKTANPLGFSGASSTSVGDQMAITLQPNSTVEYYADGNQTVSTQVFGTEPNGFNYQNLLISGTGEKTPGNLHLIVNQMTTVNSSTLKILETEDEDLPNVFTSRKGITVAETGNLVLENNANLLQDSDAVNTGNIEAHRIAKLTFISLTERADYNYWSSPVANQKLLFNATTPGESFSPGTPNNRIFQYKESNDTFIGTPDANFVKGKGYAIRAENAANGTAYTANGNPKTFKFIGTPHNGSFTTGFTLPVTNPAHGYNMVGNPYPSNIDLDKFWDANAGVLKAAAYFWTNATYTMNQQGSNYNGNNYASINRTGGVPGSYTHENEGPTPTPTTSVKPGQGFLIQAHTPGTLVYNNDMRIPAIGHFYNNYEDKNDNEKNRFWIQLTSPENVTNTLLVGYLDGATNEFDEDYDLPSPQNSDAVYTILNGEKLLIQAKNADFEISDVIPAGAIFYQQGNYKFSLSQVEGIFAENIHVLIKDKQKGRIHNLSINGDYVFETTAEEINDRFEIVFEEEEIILSNEEVLAKNGIIIIKKGEVIWVKSEKEIIESVQVYDLSGRILYTKDKLNSKEFTIPAQYFDKQIVIVNLAKENGEKVSKKLNTK